MIELVNITKAGQTWFLNKVVVNPNHISVVCEADDVNELLKEGKINMGLNEHVTFSRITMSSQSGFEELIVVGSPTQLLEKMKRNSKQLLKG